MLGLCSGTVPVHCLELLQFIRRPTGTGVTAKIPIGETEFESKVVNEILMKITKCSLRHIAQYLLK
jgi:hypothetical protein